MNRPAESLKGPRPSIFSTDAQRRPDIRDSPLAPPAAQPPSTQRKERTIGGERGLVLCLSASLFLLDVRFDGTS